MDSSVWSWGAIGLSALMMTGGLVAARNLPEDQKRLFLRKIAAGAFIPILLVILFPPPFVYYGSEMDTYSRLKPVDMEDETEVIRLIQEQTNYINQLKSEVAVLRSDLVRVNDYYSRLAQFIVTGALVFCVVYPISRREDETKFVERYPLGLNDKDDE